MNEIYSNLTSEEDIAIELDYFDGHIELNRINTLLKIDEYIIVVCAISARSRKKRILVSVFDTNKQKKITNIKNLGKNNIMSFDVGDTVSDSFKEHFGYIRSSLKDIIYKSISGETLNTAFSSILKRSLAKNNILEYIELHISKLKPYDKNVVASYEEVLDSYKSDVNPLDKDQEQETTPVFEYIDFE